MIDITLKEADKAAQECLPVIHEMELGCKKVDIEYKRITRVGYAYDGKGNRKGFVELQDRCNHSVIIADPKCCRLPERKEK